MDLIQHIDRGVRAREVLENEIYIETFDTLKQEIINQWQQSPARDQEGREKLFLMIGIMDKLKALMQSTMETGKLSKDELMHKRTLQERARAALGMDY